MAFSRKMAGATPVTMPNLPDPEWVPSQMGKPSATSRFPLDDPDNPPMETRGGPFPEPAGGPSYDDVVKGGGGGILGIDPTTGKSGLPGRPGKISITDPDQGPQKGTLPMPAGPQGATGGMVGGAKPDLQQLLTGAIAGGQGLQGPTVPDSGPALPAPDPRGAPSTGAGDAPPLADQPVQLHVDAPARSSAGGSTMPAIKGGDIAQQVRDYFQSRGVTPNESTPQYWAEKWNEFGQKDPNFNRRLSQADEFGGGGGLAAGGGGGLSASDQAAGGGPLFQSILSLLRRGEQPVSASDPNIRTPTAAFKAQTDHATRQARSKMAERAAQQGLNAGGAGSGAFDSGIRSMLEQGGRDVASYEGGLLTDEIGARRGDVRDALGLGNQSQQFYDSLSANIAQGNNSANLQQFLALLAGLGG